MEIKNKEVLEINSKSLKIITIFKKVVQLPMVKLKAGDQDSMNKGIQDVAASDKEEVELTS